MVGASAYYGTAIYGQSRYEIITPISKPKLISGIDPPIFVFADDDKPDVLLESNKPGLVY